MNLPFLDLASPGFSTRSDEIKIARATSWCARTPFGLAVLRHREAGLLLRDKRLRQGSHNWPDTHNLKGGFAEFWKRSLISTQGTLHKQLRQVAISALSPEFIHNLQPEFDTIADILAYDLACKSSPEFMMDFSKPFAGQAIAILLGMEAQDWERVSYDASNLGLAMGIDCKKHESTFNAAYERLAALTDELINKVRSGDLKRGFVKRIVEEFDASGIKDHQALQDLIVIAIFGGVDTTKSQLGFLIDLFIKHPDQWQLLRSDKSLIANAIEEAIRANPTTTWASREATETFVFGDTEIRKGEVLHIMVHASARDPSICENPQFNITLRRKMHFGFGGGAHHCIGHLVARTDMASAINALSTHLKSFTYSDMPKFLPDSGNTSPLKLPLAIERQVLSN